MPPSKPWILISPANRGIGFELARHVLRTTDAPVVTTARRLKEAKRARMELIESEGKDVAERIVPLAVDLENEKMAATTIQHCGTVLFPKPTWHLHLALIAPGYLYPEKSPSSISKDEAIKTFSANTLVPLLALKHFSPYLPTKSTDFGSSTSEQYKGLPPRAVWATLSARVGSISDNRLGGWYSYRASKAAVNQVTRTFDNHLRTAAAGNAMAVALHPGTVKTGLSREFWGNVPEGKLFEPAFAAERLVDVLKGLEVEKGRGRCWDWKGEEVPP